MEREGTYEICTREDIDMSIFDCNRHFIIQSTAAGAGDLVNILLSLFKSWTSLSRTDWAKPRYRRSIDLWVHQIQPMATYSLAIFSRVARHPVSGMGYVKSRHHWRDNQCYSIGIWCRQWSILEPLFLFTVRTSIYRMTTEPRKTTSNGG